MGSILKKELFGATNVHLHKSPTSYVSGKPGVCITVVDEIIPPHSATIIVMENTQSIHHVK